MKALCANLNENVTSWPIIGVSLPPLKLLETARLQAPKVYAYVYVQCGCGTNL